MARQFGFRIFCHLGLLPPFRIAGRAGRFTPRLSRWIAYRRVLFSLKFGRI